MPGSLAPHPAPDAPLSAADASSDAASAGASADTRPQPEPHARHNAADTVPHVVLDSNVWIDILVFDDPHTRPILAALERGALRALIDARCQDELTYVLDYPQFAKRAIDKDAVLATLARLTHLIAPKPPASGNESNERNAGNAGNAGNNDAAAPKRLPQCKDRDDQKFIELAHRGGAQWLVSKDRAVLKLARRVERDFGFRIAQPARFVEVCLLHDQAQDQTQNQTQAKAHNETPAPA
jgi:uncharacterized protein